VGYETDFLHFFAMIKVRDELVTKLCFACGMEKWNDYTKIKKIRVMDTISLLDPDPDPGPYYSIYQRCK
jgi:hypothetical protein